MVQQVCVVMHKHPSPLGFIVIARVFLQVASNKMGQKVNWSCVSRHVFHQSRLPGFTLRLQATENHNTGLCFSPQ